jgi:hypothetical protein
MTITDDTPAIEIHKIPVYFGGGRPENTRTLADLDFHLALDALVALTGRPEKDPAVRLILSHLDVALAELLSNACDFGRCIPDGLDRGIDEWDDDTLEAITGYRRPAEIPA